MSALDIVKRPKTCLPGNSYEAQPFRSDMDTYDGGHIDNEWIVRDRGLEIFEHLERIRLGVGMQDRQVFERSKLSQHPIKPLYPFIACPGFAHADYLTVYDA